MNDFNLRPEIMGFGSPIRAEVAPLSPNHRLVGQAAAARNAAFYGTAPENSWTRSEQSDDFDVNGLGQLRTALALPASEAEIAASMRHADAAPIARAVQGAGALWGGLTSQSTLDKAPIARRRPGDTDYEKPWVGVDKGAAGGDQTAVMIGGFRVREVNQFHVGMDLLAYADQMKQCLIGDFGMRSPEFQALDKQRNEIFKAMADAAAMQANPSLVIGGNQLRETPAAMQNANAAHHGTPSMICYCEGCERSRRMGRFAPLPSDDQRPLTEILAQRGRAAQAAASDLTVTETLKLELQGLIVRLVGKEGRENVRGILMGFGGKSLRDVPSHRYAELKARLQSEIDIPF